MSLRFPRSVGAVADVKELEYIAALHQTCSRTDEDFVNRSIDAKDVKHYLMSRHGIDVSEEYVRKTILRGLGGGDSEEECLDLVELTAILIIPTLVQAASMVFGNEDAQDDAPIKKKSDFIFSWKYRNYLEDLKELEQLKPSSTLLADVLRIILIDVTGSSTPPPLTKELIYSIFATYDEVDLVKDDDLVEEMILVASGGRPNAVLDEKAFARALTDDVDEFDARASKTYTTHFEDALGSPKNNKFPIEEFKSRYRTIEANETAETSSIQDENKKVICSVIPTHNGTDLVPDEYGQSGVEIYTEFYAGKTNGGNYGEDKTINGERLSFREGKENFKTRSNRSLEEDTERLLPGPRLVNTYSNIDLMSETFRSSAHIMAVMISLPFGYYNFFYSTRSDSFDRMMTECPESDFGCEVGYTIWNWILIMLKLSTIGTIYAFTLSLGNQNDASYVKILLGIFATGLFIFVPNFLYFDAWIFSTIRGEGFDVTVTRWIHVSCGIVIMFNHFMNLIRSCFATKTNLSRLSGLIMGGNIIAEHNVKQSAAFKVNRMIKNAYSLHQQHDDKVSSSRQDLKYAIEQNVFVGRKEREVSTHALALLNYTNQQDEVEDVGGFCWAWKEYIKGDLQDRDGIWIHSRILSGICAQFICLLVFILFFFVSTDELIGSMYPKGLEDGLSNACAPFFDYNKCYFPSVSSALGTDDMYLGIAVCSGVKFYGDCDNKITPLTNELEDKKEEMCDYIFNLEEFLLSSALDAASSHVKSVATVTINNMTNGGISDVQVVGEALNTIHDKTGGATPNVEDVKDSAVNFFTDTFINETENTVAGVTDVIEARSDLYDYDGVCPLFNVTTHWAATLDSTEGYYCKSQASICALTIEASGYYEGDCIMGLNSDIIPGQFYGSKCKDYPEIASMRFTVSSTIPMKWEVIFAAIVGQVCLISSLLFVITVAIPSTVSSTLKFRSGYFPTLHNPDFNKYRVEMEDMSFLLGLMLWGVIFSACIIFIITGGIAFIAVWHVTRPYVLGFASFLIGVTVTLILKVVLIKMIGRFNCAGFYRKRPALSNVTTLALECWNMALAVGYMISRVTTCMICASVFIARVDTPFLAEGGIGDRLDRFPHIYRKEILATEAHRHPYIERIGLIYMMSLRHGENFCRKSGSMWRLLFVFSLMPWLRKFRILGNDDQCAILQDALLLRLSLKKQKVIELK